MQKDYRSFYESIDREKIYTAQREPEKHGAYKQILLFVEKYKLRKKDVLEIGSSKGLFQDLVEGYVGLDIATSLKKYYHKPYFTVNENGTYPFKDNTFDAVWTWAVFEHIPQIDNALMELVRVTRPNGYILFAPAWQCRSWAAEGYPVRPYSDFDFKGKLIKASIPVRNAVLWRSLKVVPMRIVHHISYLLGKRFQTMPHKKLKPNYEKFWMSDSDAVNSIDPHAAIMWFESNGCQCLSHPMHLRALTVRTGALIFQKKM